MFLIECHNIKKGVTTTTEINIETRVIKNMVIIKPKHKPRMVRPTVRLNGIMSSPIKHIAKDKIHKFKSGHLIFQIMKDKIKLTRMINRYVIVLFSG
jgi:hypothetical protein